MDLQKKVNLYFSIFSMAIASLAMKYEYLMRTGDQNLNYFLSVIIFAFLLIVIGSITPTIKYKKVSNGETKEETMIDNGEVVVVSTLSFLIVEFLIILY